MAAFSTHRGRWLADDCGFSSVQIRECFSDLRSGASILRGRLGEQSPTFLKVGVDGLVILGFDRLLLVVALGISVMSIVNKDYLKLVLLYVYVNNT